MSEWIVSGNPQKYDVLNAFRELRVIDWQQSANIMTGDIVYIYVSGNVKAIVFKCRVNKVDIPVPDIDDRKYDISGAYDGRAGRYMELEMLEEFSGNEYSRDKLITHGFSSPLGPIRMPNTVKTYLDSITASAFDNPTSIDYIGVISYIENNRELPYTDPNKAGLTEEDRERYLQIKQRGQDATAQLKQMAALCASNYGLSKCMNISWLDGSNTKTRKYLWAQMKYADYSDNPACISIFVEMRNAAEACYRISLEIKNDGADKATMARYHSHLELPLDTSSGLVYVAGSNEWGRPAQLSDSQDEIKAQVQSGGLRKVQICRIIEKQAEVTNDYYERAILSAVEALLPYYDHVVGKEKREFVDVKNMIVSVFDKNVILYGPPGTGKTYNSVVYAVAICDGRTPDDVKTQDYGETCKRFEELKKEGRVAFTTFHQSYGYEEFIEGIKPVVDDTEAGLSYRLEPGVFKRFCEAAELAFSSEELEDYGISQHPQVWKYTPDTTGDNDIRTDCLANNHIRREGENIGGILPAGFVPNKGNAWWYSFVDKMQVGDIVLSCYSANTIDAIGVITGECEWHDEYDSAQNQREVRWLVKNIAIDVREINNGKSLTGPVTMKLDAPVPKILELVKKLNETENVDNADPLPCVFIIDEINRGNISKIFGELITLIEDTKRKGMEEEASAILPYSGDEFSVPSNVYLLGTMNTADRSIALMDTALRRRFRFVEMMPDADVLRAIGADRVDDLDVAAMLEKINERITFLYDREHTIGHAFFTKLAKHPDLETLKSIFEKSVIPLLQEYFYEDYRKIQLVLGDNGKTDPGTKFILDEDVKVKSVFKGNADDVVDLPEKKYTINTAAFANIESYIQII